MKFRRPLLLLLGLIVVIFAAGLALVRVPSIQRRLVLRAVLAEPGVKFDVARVSAGFSSLSLSDVRLEQHGLKISLDRLEVEYSLWPALFRHRLSVRTLTASGLLVDASHLSHRQAQTMAVGGPAAAPGLLTEIKLPFQLMLDDCRVAGRILLPGAAGQPPLEAGCEITGGKFFPGEEGALQLTATVKNPAADADIGTLHAQVFLRATQTLRRNFSKVNLSAVLKAAGPTLSEQNQLKITTDLFKEAAGETYSLSVDTIGQGKAENLLALHAALPAGQTDYTGQWTVKARSAQLAPFFLGLGLPDFEAQGEGHATYSATTHATGLQGSLDANASRLEAINATWKAIGPVNVQARFDITATGPVARLRQLDIKIGQGTPVLEFSASQAVEINFDERRFRVGGTGVGEGLDVKFQGVPVAWIAPFVTGIKISGGAITGEFSITGDADRLSLRGVEPLHIDQLTLEKEEETLLSKATVTLALQATLTDRELQSKISEFTLQTPAGDTFKSQAAVVIPVVSHPPVSVQASYEADLPALFTPWLPKVHVKAKGSTDFSWLDGKVEVRSLTTALTDGKGAMLFKATTLRLFAFDTSTRLVTEEKSAVDLAKITFGRIPLDWIPLNQPGAAWGGTMEPGEWVLKSEAEKLSFRPVAPIRFSSVSLVKEGEPALTGLAVEASPVLEMAGATTTAQTGDVIVHNSSGAVLLTCKGDSVQSAKEGLRANASFNLEIPALASQPLFAGAKNVSGGRASGEIRATLAASRQLEARLTVNGLVARDGGQLLPVANLSFQALVQNDGKISLQAPLLLDRAGQRSDLNFSFALVPAGRNFAVDGKLTGEHVELADAAAVLGVFSTRAAPAVHEEKKSDAVQKKIEPDQRSAWSRFTGQFLVDIKSASAGKDWSMTGLTGLVAIDPALISLKKMEASFSEKSRLSAKADVKFEAGQRPYQLAGNFSLTEFDAGKLFKAIEPAKPPTVEGLFNVTGHFSGTGETLEETFGDTQGRFDLTSRQGIFRGLQRTSNKVSVTSKAVEMGASVLGSLLGSEKATKAAEKVAGQAYFVDQLAQALGEFNYDQLNVRLVRDESLNLTMEEISLLSPEIRLLGKGLVTAVQGKPLLEQPMNATLSFAARGKVEQLLGKLHLTDGARDEVGYAKTKEAVTVGGSLAKPDPTAFFTKIATAKVGDLLDSD